MKAILDRSLKEVEKLTKEKQALMRKVNDLSYRALQAESQARKRHLQNQIFFDKHVELRKKLSAAEEQKEKTRQELLRVREGRGVPERNTQVQTDLDGKYLMSQLGEKGLTLNEVIKTTLYERRIESMKEDLLSTHQKEHELEDKYASAMWQIRRMSRSRSPGAGDIAEGGIGMRVSWDQTNSEYGGLAASKQCAHCGGAGGSYEDRLPALSEDEAQAVVPIRDEDSAADLRAALKSLMDEEEKHTKPRSRDESPEHGDPDGPGHPEDVPYRFRVGIQGGHARRQALYEDSRSRKTRRETMCSASVTAFHGGRPPSTDVAHGEIYVQRIDTTLARSRSPVRPGSSHTPSASPTDTAEPVHSRGGRRSTLERDFAGAGRLRGRTSHSPPQILGSESAIRGSSFSSREASTSPDRENDSALRGALGGPLGVAMANRHVLTPQLTSTPETKVLAPLLRAPRERSQSPVATIVSLQPHGRAQIAASHHEGVHMAHAGRHASPSQMGTHDATSQSFQARGHSYQGQGKRSSKATGDVMHQLHSLAQKANPVSSTLMGAADAPDHSLALENAPGQGGHSGGLTKAASAPMLAGTLETNPQTPQAGRGDELKLPALRVNAGHASSATSLGRSHQGRSGAGARANQGFGGSTGSWLPGQSRQERPLPLRAGTATSESGHGRHDGGAARGGSAATMSRPGKIVRGVESPAGRLQSKDAVPSHDIFVEAGGRSRANAQQQRTGGGNPQSGTNGENGWRRAGPSRAPGAGEDTMSRTHPGRFGVPALQTRSLSNYGESEVARLEKASSSAGFPMAPDPPEHPLLFPPFLPKSWRADTNVSPPSSGR
eukprot:gnl/MRDRNA2_/MRDRNA2_114443_c0_seq1.p1 gnl/MRDRNA2_/MRDRNA2_114443_c0~~gnl/MRDRNA2_/MRDRNA2_114443_c0_seq1.p1  ORF type:complete len:960 (+),score=175.13 gnl/MRDRNA2_/MRDRNA2_114443_c0_seq1:377-2881(+)